MMKRIFGWYFIIVLAGMQIQCSHKEGGSDYFHKSVVKKIKTYNDTVSYDITTEPFMTELKTVLAEVNDTVRFLIPARTESLQSFPCSNCHSKPLKELKGTLPEDHKKAHWNISMKHAHEETMQCATCHSSANPDQLQMLSGKLISFDESYNVCSQCHSTQFKDWVGGSHGKRLGGWAPPKVMNTCVSCHNPHKPAFEKRWPARYNTVSGSKVQEH